MTKLQTRSQRRRAKRLTDNYEAKGCPRCGQCQDLVALLVSFGDPGNYTKAVCMTCVRGHEQVGSATILFDSNADGTVDSATANRVVAQVSTLRKAADIQAEQVREAQGEAAHATAH